MQVLNFLFILLEVLLLFNLLIVVHEWGHFLAARWRGLVVERFGVWFGKPIWQKKINGVVYCLGCIPAGGYVSLPQMASMETIEGKTEDRQDQLPPISPLDKIIVAFAGPLFSFGFALVFAVIVWFVGRPVGETETTTTIGYVVAGGPADKVGLKPGDKILSVDGYPVYRFSGIGDTISWRVVSSEGDTIPIKVLRDGKEMTFDPKPVKEETKSWERKSLREIQIGPMQTAIIARVEQNSPAALAGLRPNDVVVAVNGATLYSPAAIPETIRRNPDQPLTLKVRRGTAVMDVTMKPVMPQGLLENPDVPEENKIPMVGIAWEIGGRMSVDHPSPGTQVKASVTAMTGTIGALLSPKSDIKFQHLSGPVGIIRIYHRLFESEQGWRLALWFSVVLNVNLALMNLLPIPVLDGGHITLAIIEAIRRKPVNVRLLNAIQTCCAVLIIGYMLYVTFYDAQDWPWKRSKQVEIKFAPPSSAPAR